MKTTFRLALLFLIFLGISSCTPKEFKISILATTDVHGAFFPNDPISGKLLPGSLSKVSQYLKSFPDPDARIILDNGDIIQGDPAVYFFNFEDSLSKHLLTRSLEFMNYDAATVGNHDIEAGHGVYDRIHSELTIPWLAANCINKVSGEPYFEPYAILNKGPLKIAVLGLLTPRIPDWLPENIWSGMEFIDMIESARYWVPIIEEREHPDLLIGLFHAGLEFTYNNQEASTPKNENAVRLVAQQVSGFDLILAGHDHKNWNEYQIDPSGDSVLILGSESRAREIAQAEFSLTKERSNWKVRSRVGFHVSMDTISPDPDFSSYFKDDIERVEAYVRQPVAELLSPLSTRDAFFGPSAFMTLIHEVQLGISGAEISFAAPLSFNTLLRPGMLTMNDLFDLYRFENLLYTMRLSGQEILDYLNFSYSNWFNRMGHPSDHLINLREESTGSFRTATAYYNFDSALGLDYTVDVTQKTGEMVHISQLSNGTPFDLNRNYLVAINSYRGNGGGGHLTRGAGIPEEQLADRIEFATDKDLRFYMKGWLQEQGSIRVETINNWQVVPSQWVEAGKQRDYKILFRN